MRPLALVVPLAGLLGLASVSVATVSVATTQNQQRIIGRAATVEFFNNESAPPRPVSILPGDAGPVNTKANDLQTQEIARIAGVSVEEIEAQRGYRSMIGSANQIASTEFAEEFGGMKIEPLPSRKVWVAVTGDRPRDAIRSLFEPFEVEYVPRSLSASFVQGLRSRYLPQQVVVEFEAFEQKLTLYSDNPALRLPDSIPDEIRVEILSKDGLIKLKTADL